MKDNDRGPPSWDFIDYDIDNNYKQYKEIRY